MRLGRRSEASESTAVIPLERVEAAEERARQAVAARERAQEALDAAPYSEVRALELGEASSTAAREGANARELREAFERQVAAARAAKDRSVLEREAAPRIEAAGRDLEAARMELVKRAEAAQVAVMGLMDAAFAYNQQVRNHAAALNAAGLALGTGGQESPGGGDTVEGSVVRLGGRRHQQVDAGGVAVWLTHRVGTARLPGMHPVPGSLQFFPGCMAVEARAGSLFAGLSQPPKTEYAPVRWPRVAGV